VREKTPAVTLKQVQRRYNRTGGQQGFDGHSLGNSTKQDGKTTRRTERRTTTMRPSENNGSGISTGERTTGKTKGNGNGFEGVYSKDRY